MALCGATVPVLRVAGAKEFILWTPVEVCLAPIRGGGGDRSVGAHAGDAPVAEFRSCLD
jgi:hypothetical protein